MGETHVPKITEGGQILTSQQIARQSADLGHKEPS
jgi:hypothetical protein